MRPLRKTSESHKHLNNWLDHDVSYFILLFLVLKISPVRTESVRRIDNRGPQAVFKLTLRWCLKMLYFPWVKTKVSYFLVNDSLEYFSCNSYLLVDTCPMQGSLRTSYVSSIWCNNLSSFFKVSCFKVFYHTVQTVRARLAHASDWLTRLLRQGNRAHGRLLLRKSIILGSSPLPRNQLLRNSQQFNKVLPAGLCAVGQWTNSTVEVERGWGQ